MNKLTAAAKDDDGDKDDDPATMVIAEERIEATHIHASLLITQ